jgi:hypothetical protein
VSNIQLAEPASVPELIAVLDAARRGARLRRFRLLDIACRNGHRLAQVLATAAGPVLLGEQHGRAGAVRLDPLDPDNDLIGLQCRCTTETVPVNWISGQLARRARRAVWQ